jgi:hypothetical protein
MSMRRFSRPPCLCFGAILSLALVAALLLIWDALPEESRASEQFYRLVGGIGGRLGLEKDSVDVTALSLGVR